MSSGFEENDACFINWEKLTKKGNNALKDSERTNFVEHIQNAIDNGLTFTIIVDESHQNDTIKADDILALFNANNHFIFVSLRNNICKKTHVYKCQII